MGAKQSQLTPSDLNTLKQETHLTEKEIQDFYKEFKKTSPKGRIGKEEMIKLYKKVYPKGDPTAVVEEMLRVYDTDKDGTVDFREFLTGLSAANTQASEDNKLKFAFEMFDADGSGYISNAEMHRLVRALYKAQAYGKYDEAVADTVGSLMFQQLDKNRDNRISATEFVEGARKDPSIMRLLQVKLTGKK